MNTDSFIIHAKTDDIYKNTAKDAEIRSSYEYNRPLLKGEKT